MKTILPSIAFLLTSATAGFSQTVVSYQANGGSLAPTSVSSNATASNMNATGSALLDFTTVSFAGVSFTAQPTLATTTPALAVTNAQYFQFTVTPNPDRRLDLGALVFRVAKGGVSDPRGWVVRSSLDGFSTDLADGIVPTVHPTFTSFSTILPATFTNLASAVTFRFYTYCTGGGGEVLTYDDITLLGLVNTPPVVVAFSSKKVMTTASRLRLAGVAIDDVGVQAVTVNGKPAKGTNNWKSTVRLTKRNTKILIVATDTSGLVSDTFTIRVRRTNL
jgi:hypothetical protein